MKHQRIMKHPKIITSVIGLSILLALAACGGGGGGGGGVSLIGVRLPQTGQTSCYTQATTVPPTAVDCATPSIPSGQDGALRKGVVFPNPRFVVNECGTPTNTSDDVVTDSLTGLTWPRDGNVGTRTDWPTALSRANDLTQCGFRDWRLPNVNELSSLVNFEEADSTVWLNSQGFTNVSRDLSYWSSTSGPATFIDPDVLGTAWTVSMTNGGASTNVKVTPLGGPNASRHVWAVRGAIHPIPSPLP